MKNTCDKCKENVHELDLIWITSEDFEPLKDEIINPQAYEKYDAICHNCYNDSDIMTLKSAKQ